MSESPEVIQGKLGWENGDVSQASPNELQPHEKNKEIYNDTDDSNNLDDTFLQSVKEKGVLEPLVVTDDKTIISGHRRWIAAKDADLDAIPVRYSEFDSDLAKREALIEFNRQREKTPGQIVNEFEEMVAIEKQRAKEREEWAKDADTPTEKFPEGSKGEARDKAAEKVNADVSGRTLEKGKKVKDKATSDDEPEEVREAAQDAWNDLQSGDESFSGAYQNVKKAENKVEKENKKQQRKQSFTEAVDSSDAVKFYNCDAQDLTDKIESESIDHIITDPPYDENALSDWKELSDIASELLKPGGLLIAYSGKYHLPDVYDALGSKLEYYWQMIVRHESAGAQIWPRNIRTDYKPVLVYAKKPVDALETRTHDVIEGGGREKDDHKWQQAEIESIELIERLTEPNDLILDPMCGSGTTGAAAIGADRRVVLADRDNDAIITAKERLNNVL